MRKGGYTYIITNKHHTVLYTGFTSDIERRTREHANKKYRRSFSARYNVYKLLYFKYFSDIREARSFELVVKGWRREKKVALIEAVNPGWNQLHPPRA